MKGEELSVGGVDDFTLDGWGTKLDKSVILYLMMARSLV